MKHAPRLLLALALAAGIALALIYREYLDTAAVTAWIAATGMAGPLVFMAIHAIATVFFLPGSLLTLAGGALFGPLWGTIYNLAGATLGAPGWPFWWPAIWPGIGSRPGPAASSSAW